MPKIKVNQPDGEIVHFDGEKRTVYQVVKGEIAVDDAHVAAVLGSVPGSELKSEPPTKEK